MASALMDPSLPADAWVRRRGALCETPLGGCGLIAIGGPPLGGKSLLSARLAECLPNVIRFEATDDLSREGPFWIPNATRGRSTRDPTTALLTQAKRIGRKRSRGVATTVVVTTRFATAAERRRAKVAARLAGMRFLFVEARSRDEWALRRIPAAFLSRAQLDERLARYGLALRRYRPISRMEALILPALRLERVQSGIDDAVDRVTAAWRKS